METTCINGANTNGEGYILFQTPGIPPPTQDSPQQKKCRHLKPTTRMSSHCRNISCQKKSGSIHYRLMWYKRVVIFVNGPMRTYDQIICPYFGLGPTPSIFKSTDPQRSMGQSPQQQQQQQKQKRQSKNKEARSSRTEPAAEQRLTKQ